MTGEEHLDILRGLIGRQLSRAGSLELAVRNLAAMAKEALAAREAVVALWQPERSSWQAYPSSGTGPLDDDEIGVFASRSILDRVRETQVPFVTGIDEPLAIFSESILGHDLAHVLAVPLWFHDPNRPDQETRFGGCLYVDRTVAAEAFARSDVELIEDITLLVQPSFDLLQLIDGLRRDLEASRSALAELQLESRSAWPAGGFHSYDPDFVSNVIEPLRRIARAAKVGLLLLGPTGSGKSHLAQAFHAECPRARAPFITLDCSQVTSPETLAAELFGYARASGYANAPPQGRPGKAELASGGTLFIDEVSTLSLDLQQRLLRLTEQGELSRLGSSETHRVDVQVIAATNEDLRRLVAAGRFREDLYWRLSEMTVTLPPLSGRRADIPALAEMFRLRAVEHFDRRDVFGFSADATAALVSHDWARSGNIRGLDHTIRRSVLLAAADAGLLRRGDLAFAAASAEAGGSAAGDSAAGDSDARGSAERRAVFAVRPPGREPSAGSLRDLLSRKLSEHCGNITALAEDAEVVTALGYGAGPLPRSSLNERIRRLDLRDAMRAARRDGGAAVTIQDIKRAIAEHGTAVAAARALGVTRDVLSWRLRTAGTTVRALRSEVAAGPVETQGEGGRHQDGAARRPGGP
ncbi:MAG: sigma 54-interacting transcriptional regulator [Candidatus Schekmanbacteria bacterium]|nr:sigma 54-interacting transcriptional regulator [Candidatus Schekmanbacteria bacterium]